MKANAKVLQQLPAQLAAGAFEATFAARCWANSTRADGRDMLAFRDIAFSFDGERGQCIVSLGKTAVMATVQASLVTPSPFSPRAGFFEIVTRVVPIESRSDPRALQQFLDRLFKNPSAPALDVAALCVVPGVAVWNVQVLVVVLADVGNVFDAASWACTAALTHFRRDEVAVAGDTVRRFSAHERDPVPLALLHTPLSLTMLVLPESAELCLDPLAVEEQCRTVSVTVGANADGQTYYFHGVNTMGSFTYADVKRARIKARELAAVVVAAMAKAVAADAEARKASSFSRFEWAQARIGVRQRE